MDRGRIAAALGLLALASCTGRGDPSPTVVVTTSILESAVRDAAGPVRIVRLLPPGSCPGHFDLSPRFLPELRAAVAVVRHDYQGVLDEKIRQMGAGEVVPVAVKTPGSLLIPANYTGIVRQVSAALGGRIRGLSADLPGVEERMKRLERELRDRPRPWEGRAALSSHNQRLFAEWLGLKVTGTLKRADDTTPADLERLMSCEAEIIVANLQEGAQAALALGERRKIPAAVFSNFPGAEGFGQTYDDLLRENVRRLEAAWAKR
jgi:zinc transport system substrate-binding protein